MWKPPRWLPFPAHSVESCEQKHIAMLSDSGAQIGRHMIGVITKLGDMPLSFEENREDGDTPLSSCPLSADKKL